MLLSLEIIYDSATPHVSKNRGVQPAARYAVPGQRGAAGSENKAKVQRDWRGTREIRLGRTYHAGTGCHRLTNTWAGPADGGRAGSKRTAHRQRPIPAPSLSKQGDEEPSGSLSRLIVAIEMWETGSGRKPQSSEGGGLEIAPSGQTRSLNHPGV